MGGDLVGHRGLALAAGDRRSVGEATAAQLAHADLVLITGSSPVGVTTHPRPVPPADPTGPARGG